MPPDLVREVKLRAVHEGRMLKDVAAELLMRGLADPCSPANPQPFQPRIEVQANGVPVICCGENAPASRMTIEELLALEQETLLREISTVSALFFDSNMWVALVFSAHPHHGHAAEAFASATAESPACFCRSTQQSFLRLATTPALQ